MFTVPLTAQDISGIPFFRMEDLTYKGAFRIPAQDYGNSDVNYSEGPIAYNPDRHSIFIAGHAHQQAIAEFAVPEIVFSDSLSDLLFAPDALQNFRSFLDETPDDNPEGIDRIGGILYQADGENARLIVNAYEYYDAPGDNTVSTLIIEDANDLENSAARGYLTLTGGAGHTSGWLSPVPENLREALGGDHLTGQSSGRPIISRFSVGPSAFAFELSDLLSATTDVPTTKLLDFSLTNRLHPDLANDSLNNDLWTHLSKATYGFIIPGTRTYLTLGQSGGHHSGVCYKCTQDDDNLCGGYCSPEAADNYQYYWMWDVQDLIDVKNGLQEPHDVRPYDYGIFDTPFDDIYHGIGGGSFDPATGNLYLTIQKADTEQGTYARPPVVVVYGTNSVVSSVGNIAETAVKVYPNPVTDRLTFSNVLPGTSITLFNAIGELSGSFTASTREFAMDVSRLSPGLYVALCANKTSGRREVIKVIKR